MSRRDDFTAADVRVLPAVRVARGRVYTCATRSLVVMRVEGRHATCVAVGYGPPRVTRVQVSRLQREYALAGAIEAASARRLVLRWLRDREVRS